MQVFQFMGKTSAPLKCTFFMKLILPMKCTTSKYLSGLVIYIYVSIFFLHLPRKMEPIEGSETSAFKPQTPGKYPKENILHIYILKTVLSL